MLIQEEAAHTTGLVLVFEFDIMTYLILQFY